MLEKKWAIRLIRISAIFGVIGTVLGSHMAGAGSYAFRPIHAHILLVGWLSMFAWGIFYKNYQINAQKLISAQGWTGIIGAIGLTAGMWLDFIEPFGENKLLSLPLYIGGGTILLVSFVLFAVITFKIKPTQNK